MSSAASIYGAPSARRLLEGGASGQIRPSADVVKRTPKRTVTGKHADFKNGVPWWTEASGTEKAPRMNHLPFGMSMELEPEAPIQLVRVVGCKRHGDEPQLGMRHDGINECHAVTPPRKRLQHEYILDPRCGP